MRRPPFRVACDGHLFRSQIVTCSVILWHEKVAAVCSVISCHEITLRNTNKRYYVTYNDLRHYKTDISTTECQSCIQSCDLNAIFDNREFTSLLNHYSRFNIETYPPCKDITFNENNFDKINEILKTHGIEIEKAYAKNDTFVPYDQRVIDEKESS
jgi:hypothetical protein